MKILLTGGSGRVGHELIKTLREKHEITHFELKEPEDGLPFIKGDLRDSQAVKDACAGMDAVIHLAAVFNGKDKKWDAVGDDAAFEINVNGTKNILDGAAKQGVKRVVFTSSVVANGCYFPSITEPLPATENRPCEANDMYGLTKALGERMCTYYSANYDMSTICIRSGPIFPPENYTKRLWGTMFYSVDARDIAMAHALAIEAPETVHNETFVITADSPLNQVDPAKYKKDPIGTIEKLFPGATEELTEQQKETFAKQGWFSIEKAKNMLGYKPQYNFDF